jgi:hypothetical protein
LKVIGGGSANEDEKIISSALILPEGMMAKSKADLVNYCFDPAFFNNPYTESAIDSIANSALLSPLNSTVAAINDAALEQMVGDVHIRESIDRAADLDGNDKNSSHHRPDLNIESIHQLMPTGMPPHLLALKVRI